MDHIVRVCAHRGAWMEYPENTLPAIDAAIQIGVDMVEIDIYLTKDGQIVVHHDRDLFRMCGKPGIIQNLTYSEIQTYRDKFLGLPIPILADVLDLFKKSKAILNIEVKAAGLEAQCLDMIKKRHLQKQIVFSSFQLPPLLKLKELDPTSVVCCLSSKFPPEYLEAHLEPPRMAKAEYMNMQYTTITDEAFKRVSQAGFKIMAWTVDNIQEMKRLIQLGVDTIITNAPLELQKVINQQK